MHATLELFCLWCMDKERYVLSKTNCIQNLSMQSACGGFEAVCFFHFQFIVTFMSLIYFVYLNFGLAGTCGFTETCMSDLI